MEHFSKPPYIEISDKYRRLFDLGVYHNGDMLPSVREVSIAEGVNPGTVFKAYNVLVEEGRLKAVAKKGYFVINQDTRTREEKIRDLLAPIVRAGFKPEEIKEVLEKWTSK